MNLCRYDSGCRDKEPVSKWMLLSHKVFANQSLWKPTLNTYLKVDE